MTIKSGFSLLGTLIALSLLSISGTLFLTSMKTSRDAMNKSSEKLEYSHFKNWLTSSLNNTNYCKLIEDGKDLSSHISQSNRFKVSSVSVTEKGNSQYRVIVTSPNFKKVLPIDVNCKEPGSTNSQSYSQTAEVLCEKLGGRYENQKCEIATLIPSSKVEPEKNFNDCPGEAKLNFKPNSCGQDVYVKCVRPSHCDPEQSVICKYITGREIIFIKEKEEKLVTNSKCLPSTPNGISKRDCSPVNSGTCPLDRICAIKSMYNGQTASDCKAPFLITCEENSRTWQCPTYLSNVVSQDSVQMTLEYFPSTFPSKDIREMAKKIVEANDYTSSHEAELKSIVCGKNYGVCNTVKK